MEKEKKEKQEEKGMKPKRLGEGPLPQMPRPDDTQSYRFKKIKEIINGKSN